MPFKGLYRRLGVKHAEAYNLLTLAAGAIACMLISIYVSVAMAQQSQQRARAAACNVVLTQVKAFQEAPPSTAAGKNAAAAWQKLAVDFNCKEM